MTLRRLAIFCISLFPIISFAQLDATASNVADDLVQNMIGSGAIPVPGTAVLTCPNGAAGTFTDASSSIGLASGVLLTTGNVDLYEAGPNSASAGQDNGVFASDPALTQLEPEAQYDLCYLEFDIIPICDTLKIDYVFASEEYPDYVCSSYNDAFGFFITGPGIAGPFPGGAENIATIPGQNTYVTINTVNGGTVGAFGTNNGCPNGGLNNTQYYVDNSSGTQNEFNGYTVPLTAVSPVTPCETYHMKLIIGDSGDGIYDSGVFFSQAGLACPANTVEWSVSVDSTVEGCTDAVFALDREGDLTAALDVTFTFEGTATNGVDYTFINSYTFPVGQTHVDFTLSSFDDDLVEGVETINIIASTNICGIAGGDTLELTIVDEPFADAGPDITSCTTDSTVYAVDPAPLEGTWTSPDGISFTDINAFTTNVTAPSDGVYTGIWTTNIAGLPTCNISDTMEWTVLPPYYFDLTVPTVDCFEDGLTLTVNNAPGGSTYNWGYTGMYTGVDNSTTSSTVPYSDINGGNINVSLEAFINGCRYDTSFTVIIPPQLVASNVPTNVSCFGVCDGAIDATINGGTTAYTFSWDNGASTEDLTGLCPGDYELTVTDANGCQVTTSATITQPDTLTVTLVAVDMSAAGVCDGTIDATVAGGTTAFTFSWDNGAATEDLSGLCAGDYCITVTDANGCEAIACETIEEPTAVSISLTAVDALCFDSCDGTVNLTIDNPGDGNLTYNWQISSGVVAVDNLSASQLCDQMVIVTVTDGTGASDTDSIQVNAPTEVITTETHTDVSCNGGSDGTIDISPLGGAPVYTFSWDNSEVTEDLTGLPAGIYCVQITDINGCIDSVCVTIVEPAVIVPDLSSTPSTCGQADGTVAATATGGTIAGDYTYEWQDASGNVVGTIANVSGLVSGNYCVTITDDNSCNVTECIDVDDLAAGVVTPNVLNDVSCFGLCDGSANVSIANGNTPYDAVWTDSIGNVVFQETGVTAQTQFNALCSGVYDVGITDNVGCLLTTQITITEPEELVMTNDSTVMIDCFGDCTGGIYQSVIGGTLPYTYSWDNGAVTEDVTDLCAQDYALLVTDNNGCTVNFDTTIVQPTELILNLATYETTCFNSNDGQVIVIPTGGTVSNVYSFEWLDSLGQLVGVGASVDTLVAGDYTVTVTDDNGCLKQDTVTVTAPPAISFTYDTVPANCGMADGMACVYPNGGTGAFAYAWEDFNPNSIGTNPCINGVLAGDYSVTMTDANGCSVDTTLHISDLPGHRLGVIDVDSTLCANSCDGGIELGITDSLGTTYSFLSSFNNGPFTAVSNPMINLCSGSYTVIATDELGCTDTVTTNVYSPDSVLVQAYGDTTICIDGCANVWAVASGGIPPYTYDWVNFSVDAFNDCPTQDTTYTVLVTDNNGCTSAPSSVDVEILDSLQLDLSTIGPDAVCPGESIVLDAVYSGGSGIDYTITWSPDPDNGLNPQNPPVVYILADDVMVYATISDNCETPDVVDSIPLTIFNIPPMEIAADYYDGCVPLTVNFNDLISPTPIGYQWDFGDGNGYSSIEAAPEFTYTSAGSYDVSLIMMTPDNCIDTLQVNDMIEVYENPIAAFTFGPQPTTVFEAEITFDGTDSYLANQYDWYYGTGATGTDSISVFEYPVDGEFTSSLMVTSVNGCTDSTSQSVVIGPEFAIFVPNAFAPSSTIDGNNVFKPIIFGVDRDNYEFYVYDRWGNLIFKTENYDEGWDGIVHECLTCPSMENRELSQIDVYVYYVKTVDPTNNNKRIRKVGHVSLIR